MLLMSVRVCSSTPLDAATSAIDFPIAPSLAIPPALARAGLSMSDIDLFELNEAFSVVALANGKILNLVSDAHEQQR